MFFKTAKYFKIMSLGAYLNENTEIMEFLCIFITIIFYEFTPPSMCRSGSFWTHMKKIYCHSISHGHLWWKEYNQNNVQTSTWNWGKILTDNTLLVTNCFTLFTAMATCHIRIKFPHSLLTCTKEERQWFHINQQDEPDKSTN